MSIFAPLPVAMRRNVDSKGYRRVRIDLMQISSGLVRSGPGGPHGPGWTTETKDFPGTFDKRLEAYTLTYNNHLSGGIKSITDPFGYEVRYLADKVGRLTEIGTSADSAEYATNIDYRIAILQD